jgi:hypothetical protein
VSGRLAPVLDAIDAANSADPGREEFEGAMQPAALLYGRRMTAELEGIDADASELLRIAARGQHIERWKLLRQEYPEGREGYLAWRRDQARAHGERVAGLMDGAGYDGADCARVAQMLRKEGIKRDAEVQALEDAACLVFLRWYFEDFASGRDPDDVARIVAKTARKMSARGRARAAVELDLRV